MSAYFDKDLLEIQVKEEIFFLARSDYQYIAPDYVLKAKPIPPLLPMDNLKREPVNIGKTMWDAIPAAAGLLALVLFGRIWTLYLMMQLVSNFDNFGRAIIPAEAKILLDQIEKISHLKITSVRFLQNWMKNAGLDNYVIFSKNEEFLLALQVFPVLTLILYLSQKACRKNRQFFKPIKQTLFWSYILRVFIMTFFAMALSVFRYINQIDSESIQNLVGSRSRRRLAEIEERYPAQELHYDWNMISNSVKAISLLGFSVLSSIFLARNFEILGQAKIHTKYSTLYHNFQPSKKALVTLGCFFCLRRLALACTTVFLNNHIIPSLALCSYSSIAIIGIGLSEKPLNGKWWNILENLNEAFIIITGYFMLLFSEWVPDVFVRHQYGEVYVELLHGIIAVNCVVGLYDMGKRARKYYLRRMRDIKMANEIRYKKTQIDIFL